jgi:S1-C subfamily serine protease
VTPSAGSVDASEKILEAESLSQQNSAPVQSRSSPMETILAEAVIEPYVVNNLTEGLMITGIQNLKAASDLGLKNGDVIRSVNGHRLAGRQTAFQVFKKAMSGQSVGLELMRDGKIKKLSFPLR